ncbi:MAG: hypothetical protein JZU67_04525, partial [Burkholderiaceae bacterium]|nr:hypothetical protein [Burkholderiaceae bacterium]
APHFTSHVGPHKKVDEALIQDLKIVFRVIGKTKKTICLGSPAEQSIGQRNQHPETDMQDYSN